MGLREEKRETLRRTVTDTAARLFRTRGYDGTSVQDIARRAQISEATFFNHFPSKQAVLDRLTLDVIGGYATLLRQKLGEVDRPVGTRIRETVAAVGSAFAADRELMALVATRSNLLHATTDPARARHLDAYELLRELMRQGQRRGELRRDVDARQLAEVLTAAYMLTIANWLVGWWGEKHDLAVRLSKVVDVFLDGSRTTPDGRVVRAPRSRRPRNGRRP
jgi:AcrR family transcriptional regulator